MANTLATTGDLTPESVAETPQTRWTARRTALFLEHLSEHCNVTAALAYSGMASSSLYRRRRDCAAFRKAWDEALELGYARLEAILLDRAINGEEQEVLNKNGVKVTLRKISNALGLALIKLHNIRVAAYRAMQGTNHDEDALQAKIQIIKKLQQLERHNARKEEAAKLAAAGT
jgi:hypothetical protein